MDITQSKAKKLIAVAEAKYGSKEGFEAIAFIPLKQDTSGTQVDTMAAKTANSHGFSYGAGGGFRGHPYTAAVFKGKLRRTNDDAGLREDKEKLADVTVAVIKSLGDAVDEAELSRTIRGE